jgi:hypothetical protein
MIGTYLPILTAYIYKSCEHINSYTIFYLGRKLSIPACLGERERGKIGAPPSTVVCGILTAMRLSSSVITDRLP